MKSIYTKTGDEGQTSIRGGVRVDKDDIRIETNGQIDMLNCLLGQIRCQLPEDSSHRSLIQSLQRELMTVMSHVATPDGTDNPRTLHTSELTSQMESAIDTARRPGGFVLPGTNPLNALAHTARAQARTAERRLCTLSRQHTVSPDIRRFMNRLSDYLFALAQEFE